MNVKQNIKTAMELVDLADDLLDLARRGDAAEPAEVSRHHEKAERLLHELGEGLGVVILPIAVFMPNAEVLCARCIGHHEFPHPGDVGPWSYVECDRCGVRCRIDREDVARLVGLRRELAGRLPSWVHARLSQTGGMCVALEVRRGGDGEWLCVTADDESAGFMCGIYETRESPDPIDVAVVADASDPWLEEAIRVIAEGGR